MHLVQEQVGGLRVEPAAVSDLSTKAILTEGRPHRLIEFQEPAYALRLQCIIITAPAVMQRRKELQASQQHQHAERQASIRGASVRAAEAEEQLRKSKAHSYACHACLLKALEGDPAGGNNCTSTAADSLQLVFRALVRKMASKILLCKGSWCCVQLWQRRISRELATAGVQGL